MDQITVYHYDVSSNEYVRQTVPTYSEKDSWGFVAKGDFKVSLGKTRHAAVNNVTFVVDQALMHVSNRTLDRLLDETGIFMPREFDWSFIRDAEESQRRELATRLLKQQKVRKKLKGTFAETIAKTLTIW